MATKFKVMLTVMLCAALLLGFAKAVSLPGEPAKIQAESRAKKLLIALGDSIARGYGLEHPNEMCYGALLAEFYDMRFENHAVDGYTAQNTLSSLQNKTVRESIATADVICVSVGGNELLGVFLSVLTKELSKESLKSEKIQGQLAALIRVFNKEENIEALHAGMSGGVKAFERDFPALIEDLRQQNPEAIIISQTVYNPVLALPLALAAPARQFYKYFDEINDTIINTPTDILIRPDRAFAGEMKKLIRIEELDIHPSVEGHVRIYEEMRLELGQHIPYTEILMQFSTISLVVPLYLNARQGIYRHIR